VRLLVLGTREVVLLGHLSLMRALALEQVNKESQDNYQNYY
jgi:hypothetical protein